MNRGDLLIKNLCIERIETYSDIIGYVFSEGRASGHRAARGIFRDPKTPGQTLTPGAPDVSVRGGPPAMSQGENRQEAKHWLQLSRLHLRGELQECTGSSIVMLYRDRLERHIAHSGKGLSEWEDPQRC